MPSPRLPVLAFLLAAALAATTRAADQKPAPATQPFELKDGDRVLLVGGTFMEREGQFGYIETMLTTRFPDRNVTFRNLGYAGDTVAAEARRVCRGWANFGGPDEGFDRLKKLVGEIKPTVVVAAYGMAESFAGDAGLPEFGRKYDRLLDMLTTAGGTSPRLVLVGPNAHEDMGRPLPDPASHNKALRAYSDAAGQVARRRGGVFVNLFEGLKPDENADSGHLTEDGIQLSPFGYLNAARLIGATLFGDQSPGVELDAAGNILKEQGAKISGLKQTPAGLSFTVTPGRLPLPVARIRTASRESPHVLVLWDTPSLTVRGLGPGRCLLSSGGEHIDLDNRALGGFIPIADKQADRADQLRALVVAKNADFFNYWRPENDTYILGYRKHEQGRNAAELPQFKPLVEAKEREIAKLRVPQPVTYALEKQ